MCHSESAQGDSCTAPLWSCWKPAITGVAGSSVEEEAPAASFLLDAMLCSGEILGTEKLSLSWRCESPSDPGGVFSLRLQVPNLSSPSRWGSLDWRGEPIVHLFTAFAIFVGSPDLLAALSINSAVSGPLPPHRPLRKSRYLVCWVRARTRSSVVAMYRSLPALPDCCFQAA